MVTSANSTCTIPFHATVLLALIAYMAGSAGPLFVHGVHLLHHTFVLRDHIHVGESEHDRGHTDPHDREREKVHTHGDLIDRALRWSNAAAGEDRSAHTILESRLSAHVLVVPLSARTSGTDLNTALPEMERLEGRLRPEPPTPPPRAGLGPSS